MNEIQKTRLEHQASGQPTIILQAQDLAMTYNEGKLRTPVFEGLDLQVQAGETVAIVGASGAGKSTLLHLLGGLDTPTQGKVFVDGHQMSRLSNASRGALRNRALGFVYQFHHLLPEFTALENVMLPALLAGQPIRSRFREGVLSRLIGLPGVLIESIFDYVRSPAVAVVEPHARQLLESVGLGHRLHHKPGELSGGERQRAAVARALVNRPACVLGDEPTGNLDEKTAMRVFELMLDLNREHGTSLVLVTHDRELAQRLDRVLELHEGRLRPLQSS
jgi:lipoprotein-releasing system ATP-binding protein